jgi:hypothetical protein
MKKGVISAALFISVLALNAQSGQNASNVNAQSNLIGLGKSNVVQTFDERYEGIRGNRYFADDKFHTGELWMTNGHYTNEVMYRFDQVACSVQIRYPDGKEILLDANNIIVFHLNIDDKKIIFSRAKLPRSNVYALMQVIYYSPTLQLYRHSKKKLIRVNDTGAYSKGEVYDELENDYQYYMRYEKEDADLQEVKVSKKSLSKAMPSKAAKIERLFNSAQFKGDLTISKAAELMKRLDDPSEPK